MDGKLRKRRRKHEKEHHIYNNRYLYYFSSNNAGYRQKHNRQSECSLCNPDETDRVAICIVGEIYREKLYGVCS